MENVYIVTLHRPNEAAQSGKKEATQSGTKKKKPMLLLWTDSHFASCFLLCFSFVRSFSHYASHECKREYASKC